MEAGVYFGPGPRPALSSGGLFKVRVINKCLSGAVAGPLPWSGMQRLISAGPNLWPEPGSARMDPAGGGSTLTSCKLLRVSSGAKFGALSSKV